MTRTKTMSPPTAQEIAQQYAREERREALEDYREMVEQLHQGDRLRHVQRERLKEIGRILAFDAAGQIDGDAKRVGKHRRSVENSSGTAPDFRAINQRLTELNEREAELRKQLRAVQLERAEVRQSGNAFTEADWRKRQMEKDHPHLFANLDEWLAKLDAELADEATAP